MAGSLLTLIGAAGCHPDMWRQPKDLPYSESEFFAQNRGSQPLPAHTVVRSGAYGDAAMSDVHTGNPFYTGMQDGKFVDAIPAEAMVRFGGDRKTLLLRGQDRFNIFCSPCHGRVGDGNGFIAQRGFSLRRKPANYTDKRVLKMPLGQYFETITDGHGTMYSYASRLEPLDRWAVAGYIRVLQLSRTATVADVPADHVSDLDKPAQSDAAGATAANEAGR